MRSALTATVVFAALIGCASGEKKEADEASEAEEAKTAQAAALPEAATATSTAPVAITEDTPGLFAKATVQPEAARATALAAVPGGTVTKGELEEEDGALIYSFDIAVPGKTGVTEIHVDAKSGAVVKREHEGAQVNANPKETK